MSGDDSKPQDETMQEVPALSTVVISEFLPPDSDTTPKVKVISSDHIGCATYEIRAESHTMGNAMRWALSKNKKVNFCGYTIPHPSENALHIRVQTESFDDVAAAEAMEESFDTLEKIFNHMIGEYEGAVRAHMKVNGEMEGVGDGEEMEE